MVSCQLYKKSKRAWKATYVLQLLLSQLNPKTTITLKPKIMSNLLEPEDIKWKYIKHLTMTTQSHMLFRDERYKIQWEQITNRWARVGR